MAKMLQAQGKSFDLFEISWTEPVPVLKIESLLQARTDLREVVVVHHETTTGRLNPLGELGRICRTLNRRLYLDAVSSFGAEEILFEEWNLEALAGTMNKCLHGAPGVSFTLAHPRAYDRPTQATSFVLDAYRYQDQIKSGFSPFTQSIPVMRAALLALQEHHEQGGWKSRRETYRARMKRASETLARLNVPILLETDDASSCVLKSFRMPKNTSYESLHTHLKERGFIIYAGQGAFSGEIFRISLMGDLREADLRDLDVGFSSFFHQ
jgi:2-aminoethylphosphonate-pyruvate transaminase